LLSVAVVSVLVLLFVNYSLLLVVNYVVDLMMCVILVLCMIYSACFRGSLSGEAAKTGSGKKNKTLIFVKAHASTADHLQGAIYSLVNR
jgi:hypothetical protein